MQLSEKLKGELKALGLRPNETDTIYRIQKDGKNYGVDFRTNEIFWFDGENRINDPEDKFLQVLNNLAEKTSAPATTDDTRQSESVSESTEAEVMQAKIVTAPSAPVTRITEFSTQYTSDQINTIKKTVAQGADDDELAMFIHLCSTYGLDPFLKEIFYSPHLKTIMTSRDGYLKIAQRDPSFRGMQSMAVRENDEFELDVVNHAVKHKFGKGDRGKVIGAWAIVYKEGRLPVVAYADYSEYNKGNGIWNTYKSAMICKVAEAFALKRQFGISGLVTTEEVVME